MSWEDELSVVGFGDEAEGFTVTDASNPLPVADASVLAALVNRYGGGKTALPFTVTLAATPFDHEPAAGKAVRLFWAAANVDPAGGVFPTITIKIGATEVYRTRGGMAHWEVFEGAADEHITVTISADASVDGTLHVEEFTP